jgi:hypothetical protein
MPQISIYVCRRTHPEPFLLVTLEQLKKGFSRFKKCERHAYSKLGRRYGQRSLRVSPRPKSSIQYYELSKFPISFKAADDRDQIRI